MANPVVDSWPDMAALGRAPPAGERDSAGRTLLTCHAKDQAPSLWLTMQVVLFPTRPSHWTSLAHLLGMRGARLRVERVHGCLLQLSGPQARVV